MAAAGWCKKKKNWRKKKIDSEASFPSLRLVRRFVGMSTAPRKEGYLVWFVCLYKKRT